MEKMRKKIIIFISLLFCMVLSACGGKYEFPENTDSIVSEEDSFTEADDPFAADDGLLLGFISHDAKIRPENNLYIYNGGEMSIEYKYLAEGKGKTLGFLIFVNGKAQSYRLDPTENFEYCHVFQIEDKEEKLFTFHFFPVEGTKGETVSLDIVSIFNPSFMPDMIDTTSYGWYHQIISNHFSIQMEQDAPALEEQKQSEIAKVSYGEKKVTKEYIENNLSAMGWSDLTMQSLNNQTYYEVLYNGKISYDNLRVHKGDKIKISFSLCGSPGAEYVTTLFINHTPIETGDELLMQTTLSKGDISTWEIELDTSKLPPISTFYIISAPKWTENSWSDLVKTYSICLYNEETITEQNREQEREEKSEKFIFHSVFAGQMDMQAYPLDPWMSNYGFMEPTTNLFHGKVRDIVNGADGNIVVCANKLYLYDVTKGSIIAESELGTYMESRIFAYKSGYVLVGNSGQESGGGLVSGSGGDICICEIYDSKLNSIKKITLSDLADNNEIIISLDAIDISDDGKKIVFATLKNVYLYQIDTDSVQKVLSLDENAVYGNKMLGIIEYLAFSKDDSQLAFVGSGFLISGGDGFPLYGTFDVSGENLTLLEGSTYQVGEMLMGDGFMYLPAAVNKANGTLLKYNFADGKEEIVRFCNKKEGKDGVYSSFHGSYLATGLLSGKLTINIYDKDGTHIKEHIIKEHIIEGIEEEYFYRIPQVIFCESSRICIVLLGRNQMDIDTKMVCFEF